jgi:hypothetical protein
MSPRLDTCDACFAKVAKSLWATYTQKFTVVKTDFFLTAPRKQPCGAQEYEINLGRGMSVASAHEFFYMRQYNGIWPWTTIFQKLSWGKVFDSATP